TSPPNVLISAAGSQCPGHALRKVANLQPAARQCLPGGTSVSPIQQFALWSSEIQKFDGVVKSSG
ncbi:MAG TPA: hypothetical protein VK638_47485, partial [Edaphobacter sp.]|nr:hypothetical protein [Edaphobacter sp.]